MPSKTPVLVLFDAIKSNLKRQGFECIESKGSHVTTAFGRTLAYFYCSYTKLNVSVDNQNRLFAKTILSLCNRHSIECKMDAVEHNGRQQLVFSVELDDQSEKDVSIYQVIYDFNAGIVILAV